VKPEEWQHVRQLFQAAIEIEPDLRDAFVKAACAGDAALEEELRSLIVSHDEATGFLERPVYEEAAELLMGDDAPEVGPGQHVGPYVIEREVGRGGMGVVYLAHDMRLNRRVALKALPAPFALDERRRERLRREARAAAALSHPGIVTTYALEEFGDDLYIAYEYVEGEALREALARGPLPVASLIETAVQIAHALAVAHARGIVHRDLKPENVVVTHDGRVKVLDFGLASMGSPAGEERPEHLTASGATPGTPAYMAPEQIRGAPVDFRTDLFAFGILIYELACGSHPFMDADPTVTVARILENEPSPLCVRLPSAPAGLDAVVARCLKKQADQRYERTDEMVLELEQLTERPDRSHPTPRSPARRRVPARTPAAVANPTPARKRRSRSDAETPRHRTPSQPPTVHAEFPAGGGRASSRSPRWWWHFHQATIAVLFASMIYPAWMARTRIDGPIGLFVFFGVVASAMVAVPLRLHLWFASASYPEVLEPQRETVSPWIRRADWVFVVLLLVGGLAIARQHTGLATLLLAVAVGNLIAFLFIEPATTQAAFRATTTRAPAPRGRRKMDGG
jgi:serine/threonine protein kinase